MNYFSFYDMVSLEIGCMRFYREIIELELQRRYSIGHNNLPYLQAVGNAYSKYSLRNGLSAISFEDPFMRSAYIFLNTPCAMGSVARHFLNLLHGRPQLLRDSITKGNLDVCCLGGGPAAESLAIAKSLELFLGLACPGALPLMVNVTVVDIDEGWAVTTRKVAQASWKWINQGIVKLKMSFVRADLTEALDMDVQEAIRKSDVVTMVKFVSTVYGTHGREKISEMLQEIVHCIRDKGVLLLLNCSRFSCTGDLRGVIASSVDMAAVYGPFYDDIYCLSGPSLRVCFDLYRGLYGPLPPTMAFKNHVVAWQKN